LTLVSSRRCVLDSSRMRSEALHPSRLRHGDVVRLVSPASTPDRESVNRTVRHLSGLGLEVELGAHVFDRLGFLAGRDEDRLADINDALTDPHVRAVITTRGGKGAYRIAAHLDFDAARNDPKLIVGFSEITFIQLALLRALGLCSLHGAAWDDATFGSESATSFHTAAFSLDPVVIQSRPEETTSALTTTGSVTGRLIGGNQDAVAISAGWALPPLHGAILLLEAFNLRLGHIDRQLTMLANAGHLDGLVGVAVGQYTDCGTDPTTQGDWSELDVLRDQLSRLGVPILGGLPIGHGDRPQAVPIGATATLDADVGTLTVQPAVA
jgi:muramoyltetrapeptide carboxypeptidase